MLEQLIQFMRSQLGVSAEAIALARKKSDLEPHTLPIFLWQYGLLNSRELELVFDWLEVF